jgi:AraC-like DNA-binding protein
MRPNCAQDAGQSIARSDRKLSEIAVPSEWERFAAVIGGERAWATASAPDARVRLVCGIGRYPRGSSMSFDGRTRRDFLALPVVLVQLVLGGALELEVGGRLRQLKPGMLGLVSIPGANAMRVPPGGASLHAYAAIYHEYATPRLSAAVGAGSLVSVDPGEATVVALGNLLQQALLGLRDSEEEERQIFALMLAIEGLLRRRDGSTAVRWRNIVEGLTEARAPAAPSVSEMAAACGVSPAHFVRRYRTLTGATPASHVRQLRLSKVMQLLIETDEPLKELAWRAGFADAQSLAHAFRRHFGVTPGTFRARHRWH